MTIMLLIGTLKRIPSCDREYAQRAKFYIRTQCPPKSYPIDFGLFRRYSTRDLPPLEPPIHGGDKIVPEFQPVRSPACDPFPTDISFLGNMIHKCFVE
ncbi:hypothetical protein B0H19DRAFT_1284098, partial [Mycena capillaripes]